MVVGEASNNEGEYSWGTQSGFNEKVATNCSKMKVCSAVDDEVGEEQVRNVTDGG